MVVECFQFVVLNEMIVDILAKSYIQLFSEQQLEVSVTNCSDESYSCTSMKGISEFTLLWSESDRLNAGRNIPVTPNMIKMMTSKWVNSQIKIMMGSWVLAICSVEQSGS